MRARGRKTARRVCDRTTEGDRRWSLLRINLNASVKMRRKKKVCY